MIYFASAIHTLYPQVVRTVGDDAFDADGNLVQYDRIVVEREAQIIEAKQSRSAAYSSESDPLFFKAQRGEVTIAEWEAKVEEIRQRYPYPTEE